MTPAAIHIVDDDDDVREGLAWLFDSRGHATAVWDSGAPFLEAVRALRGQWPQAVVLLDVRMAMGLGGKGYALMTGDVAAVQAAIEAGAAAIEESGLLISKITIPRPAPHVWSQIL